jgi:molybdopterin-guanine dinucleotide biosynthesis protein A
MEPPPNSERAVIVLCGGRSRRLGRDKASADFHGEPLLARVVRRTAPFGAITVVVAASDRAVPPLPREVVVARDPQVHAGPLAGLLTGLDALPSRASLVALLATDLPFVDARFLVALAARRGDHDAVVPRGGAFADPLCAIYSVPAIERARGGLGGEDRAMKDLLARLDVRFLDATEIAAIDPAGRARMNVNTESDYARALAMAADE